MRSVELLFDRSYLLLYQEYEHQASTFLFNSPCTFLSNYTSSLTFPHLINLFLLIDLFPTARCVARTQRTYPEDGYPELIGPHNWNINAANDLLITLTRQDVEPEHFGTLTTFSHKDGSEQIVREAIPCLIAILRIL